MLTLHCSPENVHALAGFLRDNGAQAVSVGALDYVYTRDNTLYAKLAAELDNKPAV
jgi:ATP phosphoribosyltransferase